jgi:sphingomyelin phosphodiesterase 2
MALIKDHAGLKDAWAHTHPNVPESVPHNMPPFEALHTFGLTADNLHNSYSAAKPLTAYAKRFSGKRLDYVLYRHPMSSLAPRAPILECKASNVVFTDLVPGQSFSYSDHFGLEATFHINLEDDYETGPSHSQQASAVSTLTPDHSLSPASITTMIQALTACYRISCARSRLYLTMFFACVILLIALIISSAWLPHSWINPIYVLFTTAVAWFATTMLYVGFIYGNWEINALVNIIEELEIHRNRFGKN